MSHTGAAHTAAALTDGLDQIALPGGGLLVLAVAALAANGASLKRGEKRDRRYDTPGDKAAREAVDGLSLAVYGLTRTCWRLATGARLAPREDDPHRPWIRMAPAPPTTGLPTAELRSAGVAPARISLTKTRRHRWMSKLFAKVRAAEGRSRVARGILRVARWLRARRRDARRVAAFFAPVLTVARRAGRARARWPRVAVAAARLVMLGLAAGIVLPDARPYVALSAVAAALGVVGAAATGPGPGGAGWWKLKQPSDDDLYGPRLWVALAGALGVDATTEDRTRWVQLPPRLRAEGAKVTVRLPWTAPADEAYKTKLTELVNSRLPGEWTGRFDFRADPPRAQWTHKPLPKPTPEPPAAVDIWDPRTQEVLASLGEDDFYCGRDETDSPIIQKMSDEQAHWALSVGSGGGKSAFLQWLAIQILMKRGTAILLDPKAISMTPLIDAEIEGIHHYIDPEHVGDMRDAIEWVTEVARARNYEKKNKIRTHFPPLYLILEECNTLADYLKGEYMSTKGTGDSAADPIWRDGVVKILALGREVNVHVIAVFQDFRDTQFGQQALSGLFPFKIMGSYSKKQWDRIIGTNFPMPTPVKKAGRMVVVKDTGETTRIQTPYVPRDPELTKEENQKKAYRALTAYYKELRATHGYSTAGLYTAPPKPSPESAPALIQAMSRDTAPEAHTPGPEGGPESVSAGRTVTQQGDVTGPVTHSRDGLRLIPGQGGNTAAADAKPDPTAPPELLPLAEVARRLEGTPGIPSATLMRQHKVRHSVENGGSFPRPTVSDGKQLYTVDQIRAYYEARSKAEGEGRTG